MASFNQTSDEVIEFPTVSELTESRRNLSKILYMGWKKTLASMMRNFELEGELEQRSVDVPSMVWKLPNYDINKALSMLEKDLYDLGYDYQFNFDEIKSDFWVLRYRIFLPTDEEYEDVQETVKEDQEDQSKSSIDNLQDTATS